eukprot:gene31591-42131_t
MHRIAQPRHLRAVISDDLVGQRLRQVGTLGQPDRAAFGDQHADRVGDAFVLRDAERLVDQREDDPARIDRQLAPRRGGEVRRGLRVYRRAREQRDERAAGLVVGHGQRAVTMLMDPPRRRALGRDVDDHRHQPIRRDMPGEIRAMLDAVLQDGDPRGGAGQRREPARRRRDVIGLGRDQHPVDRPRLGGIGKDLRRRADRPARRLDHQVVDRRTHAQAHLMARDLGEPRRNRRADRAGAVVALVGVVNVPIIYFSVKWWNTLHQGASVSLTLNYTLPISGPSAYTITVNGATLKLNGAGLRTKVIFKVYALGLYLPEKKSTVAEILAAEGPRRVKIVVLRELTSEEFGKAFMSGLNDNTDQAERAKLVPQTKQFGEMFAMFPALKKGDVLTVDWIPGTGSQVMLNGKNVGGVLPDVAFYNAILRIWLGDKPVDSSLKPQLLEDSAARFSLDCLNSGAGGHGAQFGGHGLQAAHRVLSAHPHAAA